MIEINTIAHNLLNVRAQLKQLEQQEAQLIEQLKAAMVEQDTEELNGDNWHASWKNVSSSRFDSKLFKSEQPGLYQQYCKSSTTTRFVINC